MKVTFDGKTYDTESAEQEATFITYSNTPHDLYRTGDGEFFLVLDDYILVGASKAALSPPSWPACS